MKMNLDLDEMLNADESEEKKILDQLKQPKRKAKNDLADLDEEMHGKHPAPEVTDDDFAYDGDDELPDVPKKKGKK